VLVNKNRFLKNRPEYTGALAKWSSAWRTPALPRQVTIAFSARLRTTLGRVRPAAGIVTLNARLAAAPRAAVLEVLCHEVAHVAAYLLHGKRAKPHGPEWRALVAAAGYEPTTRMKCPWLSQPPKPKWNGRRHQYRCPRCRANYFVRRRNSRWQCANCHRAGVAVPLAFVSPS
jgi:SprT protein